MRGWAETSPTAFDARRDGFALVALSLAAVAIQLPIFDRWLSLLDEGAIAQIADQINHGLLPYRDGVHVAFPGVFYLTAALFELFGTSLLVLRCFMLSYFTAFVCVFYLLARTVAGRGVAFGVGLLAVSHRVWAFPHWQMLNYSSLVILPALVAVALLALDLARPRRWLPILAGASLGVAISFKQDAAITLAVLAAFLLLAGRAASGSWRAAWLRAGSFAAAGILVPTAVVLAFAPAGLMGELLHQTIWYPLVAQPYWTPVAFGGFYAGFPPLWPPWEQAAVIRESGFFSYFPSLVVDLYLEELLKSRVFRETALPELFVRGAYTLPYALLAALTAIDVAGSLRRRSSPARPEAASLRSRRLRLLLAFGCAAVLSFNRPRDWVHLSIIYAPTLLLLAPLFDRLAGSAAGRRRKLVLSVAAAGVGAVTTASFWLAIETRQHYGTRLSAPRAGLFVDAQAAAVLDPLVARLMPEPAGTAAPLAALPAQPVLNFLTGRPAATRFLTLLPNREYADRDEQVVRDLKRDPRTEIVYSIQHSPFSPLPQAFMPGVFAELVARHRLGSGTTEIFSGQHADGLLFALLPRREPSREAVLYDFAARLDAATILAAGDAGAEPGKAASPDSLRRLETWPFESPVLTITPARSPTARALVYTVDPDVPARLRFGAAMNPDRWASFFPRSLRLVARIDGAVVFDMALDPRRNAGDRRWVQADVPVPPGRHTIAFEASTDSEAGAALGLAGFAAPRLVAADDAAGVREGPPEH